MSQFAVIGESFEKLITLSEAEISTFAHQIEDLNPLHHDAEFAAATRFNHIIASGPHVLSILMAMTATHFSQKGLVLGLSFTNDFVAPVFPNVELTMRWEVLDVVYKDKLAGEIVTLDGNVSDAEDKTLLRSQGRILVTDKL